MSLTDEIHGLCVKCRERDATVRWCPHGTVMGMRGYVEFWCDLCAVNAQIEHAEEMQAILPGLYARREELEKP